MHSRIFQVSKKPLLNEDFLEEDFFYDGFVPYIADYVDAIHDSQHYDSSMNWLLDHIGEGLIRKKGSFILSKGFKERFFTDVCENLKKTVDEITVDDFLRYNKPKFTLYPYIGDPYAFYIVEDQCIEVLQDWISSAAEETPYYFGAIFDYHY